MNFSSVKNSKILMCFKIASETPKLVNKILINVVVLIEKHSYLSPLFNDKKLYVYICIIFIK